ncbi:Potassium channel subfamily member 17-like [Oopsacas minuta]|uniref:Potassium channel subfamily member 17-like n=1 Tax=Oopsacas minuta TaxID=111878 RepID=A0AAV7JVI9_9METZ|nr:Potassium channel subfamily member 17-like [Oopsacas minuta]
MLSDLEGEKKKYTFSSKKARSIVKAYFASKIIVYYIVLFVYLLLGGLFFHVLEGSDEQIQRETALEEIEQLNSNVKVFLNSLNISNETVPINKLELLSSYIVELSENISALNSQYSPVMKWTFGRSIYFSFIAITTIGYGKLAPNTQHGQIFLCFYALLGIPIFLLLVTETSKNFTNAFDLLVLSRVKKERYRWIAIFLAIVFGLIAMILIPAAIYGAIESWPYSTSLYFCFVSLTTIGFGDFVLGSNPDARYSDNRHLADFYVITSMLWLYLGLVFLAILIKQVGIGIVKLDKLLSRMIDRVISKKKEKLNVILQKIHEKHSPTKELEDPIEEPEVATSTM